MECKFHPDVKYLLQCPNFVCQNHYCQKCLAEQLAQNFEGLIAPEHFSIEDALGKYEKYKDLFAGLIKHYLRESEIAKRSINTILNIKEHKKSDNIFDMLNYKIVFLKVQKPNFVKLRNIKNKLEDIFGRFIKRYRYIQKRLQDITQLKIKINRYLQEDAFTLIMQMNDQYSPKHKITNEFIWVSKPLKLIWKNCHQLSGEQLFESLFKYIDQWNNPKPSIEILPQITTYHQFLESGVSVTNQLVLNQNKIKISWSDNSSYIGNWKNQKPHGFGKLLFENKQFYEGEFKEGKYEGKGKYYFKPYVNCTGHWKNNKLNGFCACHYGYHIFCNGYFVNGIQEGSAWMGWDGNDETNYYEGHIKNYLFHGYGKRKNGVNEYEGFYRKGIKWGLGKERLENGYSYEGQFIDGKPRGRCVLSDSNSTFIGFIIHGKKIGIGIENFKDGSQYHGPYLNNVREGRGIYRLANGSIYTGFFKNNLFQGHGKLTRNDGTYYEGIWNKGQIAGQVDVFYPNGNKYFGNIVNDKLEGFGNFIFIDGRKYEGNWMNNLLHGKGKKYFPTGKYFEGEFIEDKMEGKGYQFYPNGEECWGEFKNDIRHNYCRYKWRCSGDYFGYYNMGQFVEGYKTYLSAGFYIGQFSNNYLEGLGIKLYDTGIYFEGQFIRSAPSKGIKYLTNGAIFQGEMSNASGYRIETFSNGDIFQGKISQGGAKIGIFTLNNGAKYYGKILRNYFHGSAIQTLDNGGIYLGEFLNGKREGLGIIKKSTGEIYLGKFCNNLRHGYGIIVNKNSMKNCYYHNGNLIFTYEKEICSKLIKKIMRSLKKIKKDYL